MLKLKLGLLGMINPLNSWARNLFHGHIIIHMEFLNTKGKKVDRISGLDNSRKHLPHCCNSIPLAPSPVNAPASKKKSSALLFVTLNTALRTSELKF